MHGVNEFVRRRTDGLRRRDRSGNVAPRDNFPETMSVNRRTFIAGSAALASQPAFGAVSASGETDIAIIGAGAAGIAAARKVAAAGRRYVLLEASDRVGGGCGSRTASFRVAYDRRAPWLHKPGNQP